jgi:hypothetical protein
MGRSEILSFNGLVKPLHEFGISVFLHEIMQWCNYSRLKIYVKHKN